MDCDGLVYVKGAAECFMFSHIYSTIGHLLSTQS